MADPTETDGSALPLLASVCAAVATGSALIIATKSGMPFDQLMWAAVLVVAGLLGLVAGYWVFRALGFGRRRPTLRTAVAALALGTAAVPGTTAVASQVWKPAWERYADELGGPGACLSATPYGQQWATAITMPGGHGDYPMEVWPGKVDGSTRAVPSTVLRLTFDTSRMRPLTPADAASRELLASYGCH